MYHPKDFWETRLSKDFSIKGVGCTGFSYNYNKWMYKSIEDGLDKILKKSLKNKKTLDIGCGTGYFINYYLRKGAEDITGLDITQQSITNLKKKYPKLKFYTADISKRSTLKTKYDFISVLGVLYHIVDDDKFENSIKNIRKAAKKGSLIIIQDNFLKKYQPPKVGVHCYFRTYDYYKKVLEKNGIKIIEKVPILYFLNPPFDINNDLIRKIALVLWNIIMSAFAKREFTGNIIGFAFYHLDKLMLKVVKDSIALETIVCRVGK